jgi:hypothetical protein
MAKGFARGNIVLGANVPRQVAEILTTGGYTGKMTGKYLWIDPQGSADVYRGDNASVSAATGVSFDSIPWARTASSPRGLIDPGGIWLVSNAGATVSVAFEEI